MKSLLKMVAMKGARSPQQLARIHGEWNSREGRETPSRPAARFFFIDGDQRYEGLKTDFARHVPLVREGVCRKLGAGGYGIGLLEKDF